MHQVTSLFAADYWQKVSHTIQLAGDSVGQSERVSLPVDYVSHSVGQAINQSVSQPISLSVSHLVSNPITVIQSVITSPVSQSVS